jgi:hypothetical protein
VGHCSSGFPFASERYARREALIENHFVKGQGGTEYLGSRLDCGCGGWQQGGGKADLQKFSSTRHRWVSFGAYYLIKFSNQWQRRLSQ